MAVPKKRAADRAQGKLRWTGNSRVILMQLWISSEPEHLVSRLVAALDINDQVVKYHLRLLAAHGYVARRGGGAVRQFAGQFNGGVSNYGSLSNADLWSITEKGKAKAEELAAEREEGP